MNYVSYGLRTFGFEVFFLRGKKMFSFKDEFEEIFFGNENPRAKAKRKLNAYYDRFGEDKMKLEDALDDEDYYDYLMASGFADEVLAERRAKRVAEERASLLRADMADRKQRKVENVLANTDKADDDLSLEDKERISAVGQMTEDAYKNLDKKMIKEDTKKIC